MSGAASSDPRVCVLFALPEEAAPFLRRMAVVPALRQRCMVRVSGVGADKAAREITPLLMEDAIDHLIICGFGGGLTERVKPGNVMVADRVLDATGEGFKSPIGYDIGYEADGRMMERALGWRGTLATSARVLTTSEEKRALHARTQAQMVDMETAGAVKVAVTAGLPWIAVRVATDSVDEPLPFDFNTLADSEGNVDRRRVIAATLAQPWKIPALIRLGSRSAHAAKNLARFLEAYLQEWPD
jgi:adenosylhomocysteine nucleosidase